MEKRQIILPKLKFENAPEVDNEIRIGLEEEKSLLRNDDRDIVLDLSQQFATERSNCKRYKLFGKVKMIFRNLYAGSTNYPYLKERLSLIGDGSGDCFGGYLPYNEFAFLRNDVYREVPANESVSDLNTFDGFTIIASGTTLHQEITSVNAYQFNWNFYLTYVYSHDTGFTMQYTITGTTIPPLSFVSGDGIPFRVSETSKEYVLTSPVKHGISQGEYIIINSVPYYVNSVGSTVYRSDEYVITLLKSQFGGTLLNGLINGKRCTDIKDINNSTSQYYVHRHKVLTDISDYLIDKVGFESPIWEDEKKLLYENYVGTNDVIVERNRMESIIFDYFDPFILTGITNNLGYTPSELYTTIIFRNGNGYFNYPPKIGYSFHFHDSWVDNHFDGTASYETGLGYTSFVRGAPPITFTQGNLLISGSTLYGAFVEYNPKEMKERIISEVFHKIISNPNIFNHGQSLSTTYSGATDTNPIGLYYQPHYKFKIRELSPYLEISDTDKIENLPENARYFIDEKLWRWRDLYDDGYIDPDGYGTDYPYMNDIHYVHKDINFYLRNEQIYTNKKDGTINVYKNKNVGDCSNQIDAIPILINPTPTPTPTPSITPSLSFSQTPTPSMTITPTITVTPTLTPTPTPTLTPTPTPTPTITPSRSYGDELVVNGTFDSWTGDNPDGWNVLDADATHYVSNSSGTCLITNSTNINFRMYQAIVVSGSTYKVEFTIAGWTNGSMIATVTGGVSALVGNGNGAFSGNLTANTIYFLIGFGDINTGASIDNISVRKVL
jgi:hypothetical protein